MFEKYKRLSADEEAAVAEQLKALSQQDDAIPLPGSLRSSALLEKLQEQPSLVSLEGGLFPKKRTMYVVSTCAAAFLMVIGLVKFYPLMSRGENVAMAPAASSAAMAAAVMDDADDSTEEYQQILRALQILSEVEQEAVAEEGVMLKVAAAGTNAEPVDKDTDGGADNMPIDGHSETAVTESEEEALEEEAAYEEAPEEAEPELHLSGTPLCTEQPQNTLVSSAGEWVYWLEQKDSTILHLINSETMAEEASITLPETSMVSELAAYSNMLVCIDSNHFTNEEGVPGVTVYLYQLGEDKTASLLNTIAVSGNFDQSYLTADGVLFLASNQLLDMAAVAANSSENFSEILPKFFNDQYHDAAEPLPVENIAVIDTPVQPNYLNITAIDLANGGTACTWSFLGREGTITICDHIMQMITPDGEGGTQLISIDFSGNTVQYRISNSIPEQ